MPFGLQFPIFNPTSLKAEQVICPEALSRSAAANDGVLREFVSIPVDSRALCIKEVQVRAAPQNPDPDNTVGLEKVTCDRAGIYSVLRSGGVYSCSAFSS